MLYKILEKYSLAKSEMNLKDGKLLLTQSMRRKSSMP